MRTFLDCVPCLMRQTLDAARMVSSDTSVHEQILREMLGWSAEMDMSKPAPVLAQQIHRRLYQLTGVDDPYRAAKEAQNQMAMDMIAPLEELVVRGKPVINDVTMVDAISTGLTELVTVIDNGSDAPGTVLDDCSPLFRDKFENADLIISKGQGNFETLSETSANIYFLFQVKCPLVAEQAQRKMGSHILMRSKEWKK
ncbi:MAG: ARMT1-like domain-containing protein [Kiritimatiellae bacterium]|jgi:uncharacterized protein with ATP-grasp and redox domains|nr:ARMT1-like domain-containing protein [Kiritimatiellia bacterium]